MFHAGLLPEDPRRIAAGYDPLPISKANSIPNHTLITIPISHYCEKARWALERAGIAYVEKPHLQMLHRIAARRAGGGTTVPVLVSPQGVYADSTEILEYADHEGIAPGFLYPSEPSLANEVRQLETYFDEVLGPEGRRWMYHNETAAASLERVQQVFDEVAERVSNGRLFLAGDRFTAADLSFAALSAAVTAPEGYGVPLPPPELMPEPMASRVREFRRHPAGRFATRLYAQERFRS